MIGAKGVSSPEASQLTLQAMKLTTRAALRKINVPPRFIQSMQ